MMLQRAVRETEVVAAGEAQDLAGFARLRR
jgi:hypothetical protein